MPDIMFWFFCILTKETHMPLIGCQSECRTLLLKLSCERCFPRKRESNHQMECCQILTPEVLNSCLTVCVICVWAGRPINETEKRSRSEPSSKSGAYCPI